MPIYEYTCDACGHHFEMIQKISEKPIKQCPKCFKDTAEKLVSAPGFRLKGSGWYETDFKNKSSKEQEKPSSNTKGESKKTPSENKVSKKDKKA
jgi:putative FmdB family regulatory protein